MTTRMSLLASRFAAVVAAAIISASVAGATQAADKLTYVNDWFPSGDKGIQFYAKHKGFFDAERLDVTFITAKGSSDSITRIATGSADVGSASIVALLQAKAQANVPVKTVAAFYNLPPDAIMTIEGSKIKSLKDIAGVKLATATFASSNVFWPLILKQLNLDEGKISLLKVDPAAMTPMLVSGQVDGIISWMTSAQANEEALAERGKKLKILAWSDVGFEGYSYSAVVSDKLINERPDVARRFVRAIRAAGEAAVKDPKGVAQSIKALYPEFDEKLAEKQFIDAVGLMDNDITKKEGFGSVSPDRLRKTWEWVARAQNFDVARIDPESVVARSIMPKQ
jgi:NitT/TauT family transport system substrate-binding protein